MTTDRGTLARSFLKQVLPSGDLEELVHPASTDEAFFEESLAGHDQPPGGTPKPELDAVKRTAEKLASGAELDREEEYIAEAIIIPKERPAIDVIGGSFAVTHPNWLHYSADTGIKARLCTAIASIGRIELPDHPSAPYGGTGFVVGEGLLMTNRHVAEIFASGLGTRSLAFRSGLAAGVDFLRERGGGETPYLDVTEVVMIHPFWDMALLRVEGLGAARPPLKLAGDETDAGTDIAVIGYPAFDPRNSATVQNEVFGGVYNIKRLQPGKLGAIREVGSFNKPVPATTHDSSTLGGNSGSAVVSAATGRVVALHFGGKYLDANYAVPMAALATDPRVIDAGLQFHAAPAPVAGTYAKWWQGADGDEAVAGVDGSVGKAVAGSGSVSFTIPLRVTVTVG